MWTEKIYSEEHSVQSISVESQNMKTLVLHHSSCGGFVGEGLRESRKADQKCSHVFSYQNVNIMECQNGFISRHTLGKISGKLLKGTRKLMKKYCA